MSQQQNFPAPTLNVFSVMSNWMFADPVEGAQKRPSMRVGVFGNVPRITVKTNLPNDINHGKIDFNMDLATFAVGMAYLQDLVEGKDVPQEMKYEYQDDFVAGKKLDKIITLSTWVIGKATDGRIYMAVISSQASRPRIRFFFGPTKYHNVKLGDGSQLGADKMSAAYARGFARSSEQLVYILLGGPSFDPNAKNVANPANFAGGSGGGQQGGGRPGGNGGGRPQYNNNSSPAPAAEAELPSFDW